MERYGFSIARILVDSKNALIYTRIFNPKEEDVTIYRHTHIALFTPIYKVGPVFELRTSNSNIEQVVLGTDIPEHLRDVFTKECEHLNEKQVKTFKEFILSKQNCFAKPGEVGRTDLGYPEIKLHDEKPTGEPLRRVQLHKRHALEEEIRKQNLIEKSTSPWSSQIVMVKKKDRSWRMCVDYRKRNDKP